MSRLDIYIHRGQRDAPSKEKAIQLVTNYIMAQRSGNLKKEQAAYEKLRDWCQANGVNMENAIRGVEKLRSGSVSAIMQGTERLY